MNIFNKLTIRNLKLNKKRTIGTIIGIILSTALICGLASLITTFRNTLVVSTINDTGYYHIKLENTDSKKIDSLKINNDIKVINEVYEIGYSIFENDNKYKPYINLYSVSDNKVLDNLSFKLLKGRYANSDNEIVISEHLNVLGKKDLNIGDKITLDVGTRTTLDGEILNSGSSYSENGEILSNTSTKEFTIVGIIKRPDFSFENYNEAGYSVFTMNMKKENVDAFIALEKPLNYKQDISEILEVNDYNNINDSKYDYSLNSELLRWEGLKFSDSTFTMLYTIVGILMIIVMITSIFCIRNAFAISITEKTKMYGMLSSIGATKKQIRKSVTREGIILSLIGIPFGIFSGIIAIYLVVIVVNHFATDFVNIGEGLLEYKISIIGIIISIILSYITVYLSARFSSRRATKISPIESLRGNKDININEKKLKTPKIINKLFGTGGVIAYKNLKRSKKKYRTTVISIVSSVLVFIAMNTFINYTFKTSSYYYNNYSYNIAVSGINEEELERIIKLDEVDSYNVIYTPKGMYELRDLKNILVEYEEYKTCTYNEKLDKEECNYSEVLNPTIKALPDKDFKKYVNSLKLNYDEVKNKVILNDDINYYINNKLTLKRVYKFNKDDVISGVYLLDDVKNNINFEVGLVTQDRPTGLEQIYSLNGIFVINKDKHDLKYNIDDLYINTDNADKLETKIRSISDDSYISNIDEYVRTQRSIVIVLSIFLYGFISVISLIGVTNIFNTITSNVELRAKDFATLKSIGMTKKEFNHMVNLETIFYSVKSLFYGIVLGLIVSYLISNTFNENYDLGFIVPWNALIISIIAVFVLIFVIMRFSIKKIDRKNIIETIRNDNI